MFRELLARAPQLFNKHILCVNLVDATAEQILTTVTGCFANSSGGIPELGLGDAEQTMVFNAWERHLLLWHNAKMLRERAHFMYFFLSLVAFGTALSSVLYANAEILGDLGDGTAVMFGKILIVLPIITALVSTIRTRLR